MTFPKLGPRPRRPPAHVAVFVLLLLIAAAVAGGLVMALWNAVLVDALGARPLGYWQAVGLLLLCRVLFGNWGPRRPGPPGAAGALADKSERMSAEQRARFREHWRSRCAAREVGAPSQRPADEA